MTNTVLSKLAHIAIEAERRNLDHVSFKAGVAMREARASVARRRLAANKSDQIEIESWPDFLNWWNNNRGQNLTYIFIDTYGANSDQVKMVKKLVNAAERHEKELHEFYSKLRDMASEKMEMDDQAPPPGGGADISPDVGGAASAGGIDEEAALDEIAMGLEEGA